MFQQNKNPDRTHQEKFEMLEMGLDFQEQGNYVDAIKVFKNVLARNPGFAPAYFHLGLVQTELGFTAAALLKMGHPEKAKWHLEKTISLDPEFADVFDFLGVTFQVLGDYKSAEKHFRQAIPLDFEFVESRIHLGKLLLEESRFKEAEEIFSKVSQGEPSSDEA